MQSLSAFVAQNIGAKRSDRAKLALKYGILTSLAAGAVMGYLSFSTAKLWRGYSQTTKRLSEWRATILRHTA